MLWDKDDAVDTPHWQVKRFSMDCGGITWCQSKNQESKYVVDNNKCK